MRALGNAMCKMDFVCVLCAVGSEALVARVAERKAQRVAQARASARRAKPNDASRWGCR